MIYEIEPGGHNETDTLPLIVGGELAKLGEFPHMAAIGYRNLADQRSSYEFRCGGSLISEYFVITAGE